MSTKKIIGIVLLTLGVLTAIPGLLLLMFLLFLGSGSAGPEVLAPLAFSLFFCPLFTIPGVLLLYWDRRTITMNKKLNPQEIYILQEKTKRHTKTILKILGIITTIIGIIPFFMGLFSQIQDIMSCDNEIIKCSLDLDHVTSTFLLTGLFLILSGIVMILMARRLKNLENKVLINNTIQREQAPNNINIIQESYFDVENRVKKTKLYFLLLLLGWIIFVALSSVDNISGEGSDLFLETYSFSIIVTLITVPALYILAVILPKNNTLLVIKLISMILFSLFLYISGDTTHSDLEFIFFLITIIFIIIMIKQESNLTAIQNK